MKDHPNPHKVSPDSVTHMLLEDKFSTQHGQERLYQPPASQRFSLSPQQQALTPQDFYPANSTVCTTKGYYDGVLDPKYLLPESPPLQNTSTTSFSSQRQQSHSSLSPQYIPGITRSSRRAPAAYSWQLDDFGRDGE